MSLKLVAFLFVIAKVGAYRLQIINGKATDVQTTPYQLVFLYNDRFVCGAAIISENYALTAAHCTRAFPRSITLRAGSSFKDSNGTVVEVEQVFQHPQFNHKVFQFDFAILKFKSSLEFGPKVQPVKLPDACPTTGTSCIVSGFGLTENGTFPSDLRSTKVVIKDHEKCKEEYAKAEFPVSNELICAGEDIPTKGDGQNSDACSGDSGGPLVCDNILYGVVSSGLECGTNDFPGLYANVCLVRPWIKGITGI